MENQINPNNPEAGSEQVDTLSLGDFMSSSAPLQSISESKPSNPDTITFNEFMGEPLPDTARVINSISEEHRVGVVESLGKSLYAGTLNGAADFNEVLGYIGQVTPIGPIVSSFPEAEKWMQDEFINKPRNKAMSLREEVYSKDPVLQFTNELVESFGSMGVTLPIDIMSGGATKAALAGKVLPKIEMILSKIPNFALGSGFRGWVEGVKKEGNVLQKTLSGVTGAAESVAINTAYGTAGTGLKGISLMTTYGAANAYYEAAKEGRIATKEEVMKGAAQGSAYGIIFSLLPHLKEATKIGAEKVRLGKYESSLKANLDTGDISKASKTVNEMMNDPSLRKEFKDTFKQILEVKVEGILKEPSTSQVESIKALVEKSGGKLKGVTLKNSIYQDEAGNPLEPTVYFDDASGSTKVLPLSKLNEKNLGIKLEAGKEKVPEPVSKKELRVLTVKDFNQEKAPLPEAEIKMNPEVVKKANEIQNLLGKELVISSGYRTEQYNKDLAKRVKGVAEKSVHLSGNAFDVDFKKSGLTQQEIVNAAIKAGMNVEDITLTPKHVHIELPTEGSPTKLYKVPVEETKVSGIAREIEVKAIEEGLTKGGFDRLAEYTPAVKTEQAKKISDLMNTDIELAKRIATGKENAPAGLRTEALFTTMSNYAMKTRDGKLALELANSPIATEISAAASKLSLSDIGEPDSATSKIKEINRVKEQTIEKKLKGKTKSKVQKEIKEEIKKKIKETKPDKYSWENFLNEIKC